MENPRTGEHLNAENETARAVERGANAARGKPDDWKDTNWGRELIVGFGTCGFVTLPIIQGPDPATALVKEVFLMHQFFGDKAEIEAKFERLRAFHIGKPAGLLAFITDIEESDYREDGASTPNNLPTPAAADARRESEVEWQMTDEQRKARDNPQAG